MIGDALDEADEILRVIAERRGARQHADIVHRGELCDRGLRPGPAVRAVDRRARLVAQRAAEFGLLVAEDDAHAGFRRSERRGDAGSAAAEHQHLAMGEARRIVVGVGLVGRDAETGRRSGCSARRCSSMPPSAT